MSVRDEALEYLARVGELPDEEVDLAGTALRLAAAADPPDSLSPYLDHLDDIAASVAEVAAVREPADLADRISVLVSVLADRFGYGGDRETYDDLRNASLLRVIDRRRGLPVALGILYMHAARANGWPAEGLNFPGHFLIRLDAPGERAVVDPFDRGAVRTAPELRELLKASAGEGAELSSDHYAAVGNRDVLLRLQNNLKIRHMQAQRFEPAAEVLDTMLLMAPQTAALWRESGIVNAYLGNLTRAVRALETYLSFGAADAAAAEARQLLQRLRSQIN